MKRIVQAVFREPRHMAKNAIEAARARAFCYDCHLSFPLFFDHEVFMARVTVEDCLKDDNNRFRLVLAASGRARQIAFGHQPMVAPEHDKPTVLALREIEEGKTTIQGLLDAREKDGYLPDFHG